MKKSISCPGSSICKGPKRAVGEAGRPVCCGGRAVLGVLLDTRTGEMARGRDMWVREVAVRPKEDEKVQDNLSRGMTWSDFTLAVILKVWMEGNQKQNSLEI